MSCLCFEVISSQLCLVGTVEQLFGKLLVIYRKKEDKVVYTFITNSTAKPGAYKDLINMTKRNCPLYIAKGR